MRYCPRCPVEKTYPDNLTRCPEHGVRLSLRDPYRLVGTLINGKYQLEALLGIGGMGVVYLATHTGINRQVAVKFLKPDLVTSDPSVLESFRREATISGGLSHPHIVNVTDADVTPDGMVYMVMELLECPTLEDELAKDPVFSIKRTERILDQICSALQAAHNQQIIHRDLKPANIAVVRNSDQSETIKVLDFGIAKSIAEGAGKVSQAMGTPIYASPEQFSPGVRIDGRSDLYSLGIMTFQMLTGVVPFRGKTVGEIVRQHLTAQPPALRTYQPNIPSDIEGVVLMTLEKNADKRPRSAQEFLNLFKNAVAKNFGTMTTDSVPVLSPIQSQDMSSTVAGHSLVTLVITGAPTKAEVKVNDWPRGTIDESGPLMITDLSPGNHKVSIKKAGFEPFSVSFSCQPGERKEIKVTMKQTASMTGGYQALRATINDPTELATIRSAQQVATGPPQMHLPTASGTPAQVRTLYAPPPAARSVLPVQPYSVPKKNYFSIGLIIATATVFVLGGVVVYVKKSRPTDEKPPVVAPSPVKTGTQTAADYKDMFDRISKRIKYASDSVPLGTVYSGEEAHAAREQTTAARTLIATASNEFADSEPGDKFRENHDQLKDRYKNLITNLDNYIVSLRSYEFALQSREFNAGEPQNTRGAREREDIDRNQMAVKMSQDDVKVYEERLRALFK